MTRPEPLRVSVGARRPTGRPRPDGWTPYQPSGPPPLLRNCVNTSPPPRPTTPAPTSSFAARSKPAP